MDVPLRFRAVLDSILLQTRAASERSMVLARLVLALFLGLRLVATRTIAGHDYHRDLVLVGIIVLSAVSSIAVLVVLRRKSPGQHRAVATASILIDATMVAMGLWGLALWPPAEYAGMLQSPSSGFILLAISCAALRFSVPLVTVALVLNGATLLSLFAFEQMVQHRPMELEAALTLLTLYATFATLAYSIVIRGRQLMIDGSMSVLDTARVARHLGAFVSEEVAERALSGQEFALGGQRRPVVCLFSDLRGFTQYSERIEPEQLVAELNDYLEAMGTAIESEGGLIDKFIGDSIMVVFGMTDTSPDDAAHAVRTARAMQRALASHNSRRSGQGLPPIAQGIGIHMGAAIVGNIGTASRMQQTVVGSVVNIASRLESATKELHVAVVMSEAVAQAAQAHSKDLPTLRALPPVRLRGLAEPLPICTFAGDGIQPSVADVAS